MDRLIDRTNLYLWQSPIYPNLAIDIENQALQRVMMVAQQSFVTLQVFTWYGSDDRDIMDD